MPRRIAASRSCSAPSAKTDRPQMRSKPLRVGRRFPITAAGLGRVLHDDLSSPDCNLGAGCAELAMARLSPADAIHIVRCGPSAAERRRLRLRGAITALRTRTPQPAHPEGPTEIT